MEQLGTRVVDSIRLEEKAGRAVKLRPRRQRRRGRIEIIPMIDVMFFLLATFMLASLSLQNLHSLAVNLPRGQAAPMAATRSITLTVTREGEILLDQTAVTLDTLTAALKPRLDPAGSNVVVAVDSAAPSGIVVQAMLAARGAGAEHFLFAVAPLKVAQRMSEPAIRFRDDPWQRLPWLVPLALLVTALSQMGFLLLLRQPSTPPVVQRPVDVQVMEVTASAPVTQRTPPARRSPTPPKPRAEPPAPRPTPSPREARVEAPRDPTPAVEAEPSPARAFGGRDRPGPTHSRLPERACRPIDAGPGRRRAA